jgi:hypothetical protein
LKSEKVKRLDDVRRSRSEVFAPEPASASTAFDASLRLDAPRTFAD